MVTDGPDAEYATELLRRQDALQAEAQQVIEDLDLIALLRHAGQPKQVGSSASGLMVWRDIDLSVLCRDLTLDRTFETMRPLLTNSRVIRAEYRNQTGHHIPPELRGDERYYFALRYETPGEHEWKIDISFWLSDAPRDQLPYLEILRSRLTDETRLAILWVKDIWHRLPSYQDEICSIDIYDAVLEHGVRTPREFEVYLQKRGLPGQ